MGSSRHRNEQYGFNRLPAAIFFAKRFFTMFPNGNSRQITVKCYCKIFAHPRLEVNWEMADNIQISCLQITKVSKHLFLLEISFHLMSTIINLVYSQNICVIIFSNEK